MSFQPSVVRSSTRYAGTLTVDNNWTGTKTVSLSPTVTDTTKVVFLNNTSKNDAGVDSYYSTDTSWRLQDASTAAYTVTSNSNNGAQSLAYNFQVTEFY